MRDGTAKWLSHLHTALYRTTGGRVGRRLVDNDMLLLTTRGRITGSPHTIPLLHLTDDSGYVVFASWGGRPNHPEWYLNLLAEPDAVAQVDGRLHPVTATTMAGDMQAAAIFCLTETGFSSRLLSKHRPECPIIAVTSSQQVARRLALNWGVFGIRYDGDGSMQRAMKAGYVEPGSVVICTSGHHQTAGSTDLIRVIVAD